MAQYFVHFIYSDLLTFRLTPTGSLMQISFRENYRKLVHNTKKSKNADVSVSSSFGRKKATIFAEQ